MKRATLQLIALGMLVGCGSEFSSLASEGDDGGAVDGAVYVADSHQEPLGGGDGGASGSVITPSGGDGGASPEGGAGGLPVVHAGAGGDPPGGGGAPGGTGSDGGTGAIPMGGQPAGGSPPVGGAGGDGGAQSFAVCTRLFDDQCGGIDEHWECPDHRLGPERPGYRCNPWAASLTGTWCCTPWDGESVVGTCEKDSDCASCASPSNTQPLCCRYDVLTAQPLTPPVCGCGSLSGCIPNVEAQ